VRLDPPLTRVGARRVLYLVLWTRGGASVPIGHAFVTCSFLGRGGVFGSGVSACSGTYRLPKGYITAYGVRHSTQRYTLAVTGGTGLYAGAGGTLVSRRNSDGDHSITIVLS